MEFVFDGTCAVDGWEADVVGGTELTGQRGIEKLILVPLVSFWSSLLASDCIV